MKQFQPGTKVVGVGIPDLALNSLGVNTIEGTIDLIDNKYGDDDAMFLVRYGTKYSDTYWLKKDQLILSEIYHSKLYRILS